MLTSLPHFWQGHTPIGNKSATNWLVGLPSEVNGESNIIRYDAGDDDNYIVGAGNSLTLGGSGSLPVTEYSDYRGILYAGTSNQFHRDSATSAIIGGNNHFIVNVLFKFGSTGVIAATRNLTPTGQYWACYHSGGTFVQFLVYDGTTLKIFQTPTLTLGNWYLLSLFADKTQSSAIDSGQLRYNSVYASAADMSSLGAVDGSDGFSIGSYWNSSAVSTDATVAHVSVFAAADLGFPGSGNSAHWAALASEFYNSL